MLTKSSICKRTVDQQGLLPLGPAVLNWSLVVQLSIPTEHSQELHLSSSDSTPPLRISIRPGETVPCSREILPWTSRLVGPQCPPMTAGSKARGGGSTAAPARKRSTRAKSTQWFRPPRGSPFPLSPQVAKNLKYSDLLVLREPVATWTCMSAAYMRGKGTSKR